MNKISIIAAAMLISISANAQRVLTLDSCRAMAINNNKDLRMSEIDREID